MFTGLLRSAFRWHASPLSVIFFTFAFILSWAASASGLVGPESWSPSSMIDLNRCVYFSHPICCFLFIYIYYCCALTFIGLCFIYITQSLFRFLNFVIFNIKSWNSELFCWFCISNLKWTCDPDISVCSDCKIYIRITELQIFIILRSA